MVLVHDADIVTHRESCHVRWTALCGSSEGAAERKIHEDRCRIGVDPRGRGVHAERDLMVLVHDADIVTHRESCHVRWTALCGSSEGAGDLNSWIVRRGSVSLDSDIGGPAMAVFVIRNGFPAVETIRRKAERINNSRTQQIGVTDSERLSSSVISGASGPV